MSDLRETLEEILYHQYMGIELPLWKASDNIKREMAIRAAPILTAVVNELRACTDPKLSWESRVTVSEWLRTQAEDKSQEPIEELKEGYHKTTLEQKEKPKMPPRDTVVGNKPLHLPKDWRGRIINQAEGKAQEVE